MVKVKEGIKTFWGKLEAIGTKRELEKRLSELEGEEEEEEEEPVPATTTTESGILLYSRNSTFTKCVYSVLCGSVVHWAVALDKLS